MEYASENGRREDVQIVMEDEEEKRIGKKLKGDETKKTGIKKT